MFGYWIFSWEMRAALSAACVPSSMCRGVTNPLMEGLVCLARAVKKKERKDSRTKRRERNDEKKNIVFGGLFWPMD